MRCVTDPRVSKSNQRIVASANGAGSLFLEENELFGEIPAEFGLLNSLGTDLVW